jgi:hypothetical protein
MAQSIIYSANHYWVPAMSVDRHWRDKSKQEKNIAPEELIFNGGNLKYRLVQFSPASVIMDIYKEYSGNKRK